MKFESASDDQLKVIAAILGTALHQDGVGWHRFAFTNSIDDAVGIEVQLNEELTPELVEKVGSHIDSSRIFLAPGKNSIRFLKGDDSLSGDEFRTMVNDSLSKASKEATRIKYFSGELGFFGLNDYQEVINEFDSRRTRETSASGTPGRPDFQKSLRNFYDGIQKTRIDFAKRKGWGAPKRETKLSEGSARSEEVTNNQSDLEGLDTIGVPDPSFLLSPHERGGTSKMSETQTDQTLELGEMRAKLADAEKHNAQYQARLAELESMNRETAKELPMG